MLKEKLMLEITKKKCDYAFVIEALNKKGSWKYRDKEVIKSASLIKIYIMAEAVDRIKNGKLSLDTEILVQSKDIVDFSVLQFLKPRSYQVEELLRLMIVYSDNTATNVLIDYLGIDEINKKIRQLGFEKTTLQRKMMDFESAKAGKENYTVPEELADFLKRVYKGTLLGREYDNLMLNIMKGQADESMMRDYLPDEISIARKSGELDCLDHDIAVVFGEKTEYIFCCFIWNAESNNDARQLLGIASKITYDFLEDK